MTGRTSERLFTEDRVDRIFRVINRQLKNDDRARDATQDLFFEVFRNIDRFDRRRGSFDAWINGFVPIILMRQHKQIVREQIKAHLAATAVPVDAPAVSESVPRWLLDGLKRLLPRDRELLFRRHVLDASIEQLAQEFDLDPSAVTTALGRARRRLRKELEGDGPIADQPPPPRSVPPPSAGS